MLSIAPLSAPEMIALLKAFHFLFIVTLLQIFEICFQKYDKFLSRPLLLISISSSKGNQTTKFEHLIELTEYNIRTVFLKKSYIKCGVEKLAQTLF